VLLLDSARGKLVLFRRAGGKFASPFHTVGTREAGCRSTGTRDFYVGVIELGAGLRLKYCACFGTICNGFDCIQRRRKRQSLAALAPPGKSATNRTPSLGAGISFVIPSEARNL
jgi:hypothetical protein